MSVQLCCNCFVRTALCAVALSVASTSLAGLIVHDTWQDGNRNEPTTAAVDGPYSENGVDSDGDGDLESVWYSSPAAALTPSTGHLLMTQQSGSSSYTTFFTPEASQVTIAQGATLQVKWVFTPNGLGTDQGRGLRMALVNTGAAERRTTDGSPINSVYSGYRVSLNVNSQGLPANAIEIRERTNFNVENLLVNDDRWSAGLASAGTASATSMVNGTEYTYLMSIQRTFADELIVSASVTGGNINNTGALAVSYTDATPNNGSFTFDTYAFRPSSATVTAATFDTTLFEVSYVVPEPASLILGVGGLTALGLVLRRR